MCCGQNRAAARAAAIAAGVAASPKTSRAAVAPPAEYASVIMFELLRGGATVVRGPVSGQMYRFGRPGDRVRVDARDRPGLLSNPALRWVR